MQRTHTQKAKAKPTGTCINCWACLWLCTIMSYTMQMFCYLFDYLLFYFYNNKLMNNGIRSRRGACSDAPWDAVWR